MSRVYAIISIAIFRDDPEYGLTSTFSWVRHDVNGTCVGWSQEKDRGL